MSDEKSPVATIGATIIAAGAQVAWALTSPPGIGANLLWFGAGLSLAPAVTLLSTAKPKISTKFDVTYQSGDEKAKDCILTIRVDGPIVGNKPKGSTIGNLLAGELVSGYEIQQVLAKAADQPKIKAVIMQFSTPGGMPLGAQAILDGILDYKKKTGNPIIAHVEGMSASGGVYAMVGADRVYAEPGSLVGSIGVTLGTKHWYDVPTAILPSGLSSGVETRAGVKSYFLGAGKGKDLFSPWRKPNDEEVHTLNRQLDAMYGQFVSIVSKHRNISVDVIRDQMGAYVFANEEAQVLGLIDGTMTRQEVIAFAASQVDIAKYQVVSYKPKSPGLISKLFGSSASLTQSEPSHHTVYGALAMAPESLAGVNLR